MIKNTLQIVLYNPDNTKNLKIINDLANKMENVNINDECRLCKKLREKMGKKHTLFFGRKFKCSNI
jgi:hypothetical protein